jgi:hypothetical protein
VTVIRFLPGGEMRKLFEPGDRQAYGHAVPRRASRVEVIPVGPHRGKFFVDFSLLGPDYQLCLAQPFDTHDEAVRAEQAWLLENWILKVDDNQPSE